MKEAPTTVANKQENLGDELRRLVQATGGYTSADSKTDHIENESNLKRIGSIVHMLIEKGHTVEEINGFLKWKDDVHESVPRQDQAGIVINEDGSILYNGKIAYIGIPKGSF